MKSCLLRAYRIAILAVIAWLIHDQASWGQWNRFPRPGLAQVRLIFPDASELGPPDPHSGVQSVIDAAGSRLGGVLTTSPSADRIVGYSGPSNLLVGMDPSGAVKDVRILSSQDTPEHVAMIESRPEFLRQFQGWDPSADNSARHIDAVSGATLTSLAMAEGLHRRLTGNDLSLRFPEPLTLAEAAEIFPAAASLTNDADMLAVRDGAGALLGFLLRTSPQSDAVRGFRGPTDCLVALEIDRQTVKCVRIRRSYDTSSYVDVVREDPAYLKSFAGRTLQTLASLDYEKEGIEGVSGSTRTSFAVAEGLKLRAAAQSNPFAAPPTVLTWKWRDWALVGFVAGAALISFSPLRGRPRLRFAWQIALISGLGLFLGEFVSLALLGGWMRHGPAWQAAPGLCVYAAAALAIPWAARRQIYCHHLCPHGAAQEMIGRLRKRKFSVPHRIARLLEGIPFLLLAVAAFCLLGGAALNLTWLEPFDAWIPRAGAVVCLILALAGLAASAFIPHAYCRFGCPTGALLRFLRFAGSADRFGRRDAAALILTIAALAFWWWRRLHH
jgi:Na+-translocating ferredoxin:NAD+ oxidoreductase RnfG subunit